MRLLPLEGYFRTLNSVLCTNAQALETEECIASVKLWMWHQPLYAAALPNTTLESQTNDTHSTTSSTHISNGSGQHVYNVLVPDVHGASAIDLNDPMPHPDSTSLTNRAPP